MNYGLSGSTIAKKHDADNDAMCVRYASMQSADVVMVMGGINDLWSNIPLGKYGDKNPLTFYGGMDALCKGLLQRFPTKKIIFITPTEQNNNGANLEIKTGYTAKDYANVMNIICSKYGIPVFDANACSGINPVIGDISGMYTTDSLHLNDAGHERLGVLLSQFLLNPFSVGFSP